MLRISNSQIGKLYGYESCEGKWFWNYHKGWEPRKAPVNHNFIIGGIYHEGTGLLYAGKSLATIDKHVNKLYDAKVQEVRETCDVQEKDEVDFVRNRIAVRGMIHGYARFHKEDMRQMKQVSNEFTYTVPYSSDVHIMIKIDNIISYKTDWFIHELKTVKSIDPKYVENRQYDFQTALYFYLYNDLFNTKNVPKYSDKLLRKMKPVKAILYDAVQKLQIRLKANETERQFLSRIEAAYTGADAVNKFYMEDFNTKLPFARIKVTISAAIEKMLRMQEDNTFVPSFASCAWCDYKVLCFEGGETRKNLTMFRKKEEK